MRQPPSSMYYEATYFHITERKLASCAVRVIIRLKRCQLYWRQLMQVCSFSAFNSMAF